MKRLRKLWLTFLSYPPRLAALLVVIPFHFCGWLAGTAVKAYHLARAGLRKGFEQGRQI